MGWLVRRWRSIVVSIVAGAIALACYTGAVSRNNLHLHVAEELRLCRVDVVLQKRPILPRAVIWKVRRVHPAFGNGPLGRERIASVVLHDETDVERAVSAMCRLRYIPDVTVRTDNNGDIITVAQLGRVLNSVQPERLVIDGVGLPQTAIPALNIHGLKWLQVADTDFSNAAIKNLPTSIEYLDATRTRIDDGGLSAFVPKINLKKLILRQNAVSDSAIINLSKQMPWCQIYWQTL